MKRALSIGAGLAALIMAAACATMPGDQTPQAEIGTWGFDLEGVDAAVDPGDDFYRYAGGTWMANYEIPADRSRYGSFDILRERSEDQVRAIVEDLASREAGEEGSVEQQIGDLYQSWMDVDGVNARGLEPLQPYLDEFAAIETREDLMHAFADIDNAAPFGVGIIPDPADTTRYTVFVGQGGLGMPDRDYYLRDDDRFVEFRTEYVNYITQMLSLAGFDDARARADRIMELETQIAEDHWTSERSRQISEIYNPMSMEELQALAPDYDWSLIMGQIGLLDVPNYVVAQTTAIAESGALVDATPISTWRDYLAFHFIDQHAAYLPAEFDEASFDFHGRTLEGREEQRERWKRGVSLLNNNIGEAVGQIYVERHYPDESRRQMTELIANLRAALGERLAVNDWMDDETREAAQLKLSTFEPRIGHPVEWIDYSSLDIAADDLLGNVVRANEFEWNLELERLGGPVDRDLWGMNPQTVNAYYNPLLNQITFPAAILQPPFFDPGADPAVNYGAIGAVIGHEIGHGFDDQGRQFDETGLIRDWWTAESNERFQERSSRLGAQYDAFEPIEGMNVNGSLTMGENIGDLGGLEMAYAAYRRYVEEHGEPPVLDGYTGDQRFFLAWAQVWRGLIRDDALRQRLVTDPHSPMEYRTNGVVRNIDAWYEAFNVTEDDALYLPPEERVHIW